MGLRPDPARDLDFLREPLVPPFDFFEDVLFRRTFVRFVRLPFFPAVPSGFVTDRGSPESLIVNDVSPIAQFGVVAAVSTKQTSFTIVDTETLERVNIPNNGGLSLTVAEQLLNTHAVDQSMAPSSMMVLPSHELEAA